MPVGSTPGAAVYSSPALESVHYGPAGELFRGTVHPVPNFNAEKDCEVLRKAMKGAGTDEAAIVAVVGHRSNDQRQQIKKMFKTMYGKDLLKELKGELSGHFRELCLALFYESTYYDAHSLREAMKGAGTREGVLIEILTTRTNEEIQSIREQYKTHIQRDLEKDVTSETSGFFRRVLISCLQANRNELNAQQMQMLKSQGVNSIIDYELAKKEANELYMAGEKKVGTDEACFIRIIGLRNIYQLRATFEEYQKIAKRDILSSIDREMSGDLRKALKTQALSAINRPLFFAKQLQKSMKGLGTNDSALIRIVVSRSEIDLENIKEEFQKNFGKSLQTWVRDDTSGDYRKLLEALLGK